MKITFGFHRLLSGLAINLTLAEGTATGNARRKIKSVTPQACSHDIFKVRQRWTY